MDFEKKDIFILISNHWIFWVSTLIAFSFFSIYNIARRNIYFKVYINNKRRIYTNNKKNYTEFKLLFSYKNSFLLP